MFEQLPSILPEGTVADDPSASIACLTAPLKHQLDLAVRGISTRIAVCDFSEQGTGKSWSAINAYVLAYRRKEIEVQITIAPPGVERNWKIKEFPKHLPRDILDKAYIYVYDSHKASTKAAADERKFCMTYRDGLLIVCISYHAAVTVTGKKFLKDLVTKRKCFVSMDESHFAKTPNASRTKTMLGMSAYPTHKRCMTGTPMGAEGPLDLYAQVKFIDRDFWKRKGIPDYQTFKNFFADWFMTPDGWPKKLNYKNIPTLNKWLAEISFRVLKRDVLADLPERTYTRRYLDLPPEHRRVYNQLRRELKAQLLSGAEVEVLNPLVMRRKFMQICCGYLCVEKGEPFELIDGKLPRIDAAVEWADASSSQGIIWTRFRMDVDKLIEALGPDRVARYDGALKGDDRQRELESFERGDKQFLASNPAVGGTGLTLNNADRSLLYAMGDDPVALKQAFDRNHRPGQHNAVNYELLMMSGTVDERILEAHLANNEVSCQVLGDEVLDWI